MKYIDIKQWTLKHESNIIFGQINRPTKYNMLTIEIVLL